MDVSADNNRGAHWHNIRFLGEHFFGLGERGGTFSQRALISDSGMGLQVSISSICRSSNEWSMSPFEVIV